MAAIGSTLATVRGRRPVSLTGRDADRTVVWLRGEHDASTAAALSETIGAAISLDDADLVVDLAEVRCISSSTVDVFIRTRDRLRRRARSMALRAASPCVRRILEACGLHDLFEGPNRAVALSSWVTVPATGRVDDDADASVHWLVDPTEPVSTGDP